MNLLGLCVRIGADYFFMCAIMCFFPFFYNMLRVNVIRVAKFGCVDASWSSFTLLKTTVAVLSCSM